MRLFSTITVLSLLLAARCVPAAAMDSDDEIARDFLWDTFAGLPAAGRPKVGVALSGGGTRGFAHVGVLEVLSDAGFPVDCVSGTSMGAVVGSFFCAGLPFSKMWDLGRSASFSLVSRDFRKIRLLSLLMRDRLMSSKSMENFITKNIGDLRFSDFKIPFSCVAMDFKTGEKIVFREGPVAPAVRASMNLPGIFSPVEYRHRYLVDGGVIDFIPVDIARELGAQWVLASITAGDFSSSP
ncbi:MAG: patatin-like phospholipase family protein, partial [bacterium]